MRVRPAGILAVALLASAAAACATSGGGAGAPPPTRAEPGMTDAEIEALYRMRTDSARMRFTDADVAFMNAMIHHHAQALHMAQLAPERTTNESIRTLAARIINSQRDEIATMQRWLRDRGQPSPELHVSGDTVMVHGGADHDMAGMPGIVGAGQLAELARARGVEFDRLFLRLMIEHHRGAVTMVRELSRIDGALQDEDAFRLAADVQVDQQTEIARMERMLAAMSGTNR